jgi:uncharacterized membrane protein
MRNEEWDENIAGSFNRSTIQPVGATGEALIWRLQKNCSMSPGQLAAILAIISVPSLLAGVIFWMWGAPLVLLFSILEVCVMATCFIHYARHAADAEMVTVTHDTIDVRIVSGAAVLHKRFRISFAKLHLLADTSNLICISESGHIVKIGSTLPRNLRQKFFKELNFAIQRGKFEIYNTMCDRSV